jgi:glycosyltransferase involved in cell wall biosynthesis
MARTAVTPKTKMLSRCQTDRAPHETAQCVTAAILASMTPLASVVVPVFNGLPYLRDLVAALLAQDYPNLEIVLTDGGSSDGSLEYLNGIDDSRVRVIAMPAGTTAAGNWTAATEAATGEFVKLICQDDLIDPTTISRQVHDLLSHPDAVMAIAPRRIIDARGGTLVSRRGCQGLASGEHDAALVVRRCYVEGANVIGEPLAVMFRRDPLLQAMPWDDSNPLMLDISLYAKVAKLGTAVVRDGVVGAFRVSDSSWSTRLARVQRAQFAAWQYDYAASLEPQPGRLERARARLGMERQALNRRIAYRVLRLRGALAGSRSMQE